MAAKRIHFGPFRIDQANATLTHDGDVISLTPKAFALLSYLADAAGQLATKHRIFAQVWRNTVVTDAALTVCIREIRVALGDDAKNPRYIETVPKRGYRFIGHVTKSVGDQEDIPPITVAAKTECCVVGREDALERLQVCLSSALAGTRQLALLAGEPGIGKTTAIEAFLRHSPQTKNAWIAKGQCIEHYGAGEPYLPILDALGDLARRERPALTDILAHHAPTWLAHLPALSAGQEQASGGRQAASVQPGRMLREITGALEAIAERRLLILVLEDLHWSDHASIDLLSFLARRNNPARLLIAVSYRPADVAMQRHPIKKITGDLQLRGHCTNVALQFLDRQHIASYLAAVYPGHGFPADFPATVQQKCDGNPLFMVNLLAYLQSRELLQRIDGQWRLAANFATRDICIPGDIELVINQQVEQLDSVSQELLEAASVASEPGGSATEFTLAEVAAALSVDELEIEAGIERLARHKLFLRSLGTTEWPDGTFSSSYEFTHALYQKVLYARVSAVRKVQRHRQLGLRLEIGFATRSEAIATKLAVHFEIGREHFRAVQYLTKVAATAATRGANREAIHALDNARRLLRKLPQTEQRDRLEITVLLLLAPAITARQGNATPAIEECYLRARELCEQTGELSEQFRVLFGLRSFYIIRGDLDKAYELAQSLLGLATALNNPDFLLEAHVGLANSEYFAGNHRASHAQALKGVALYNRKAHAGHALLYGLDPGVFCYARAGQTAWFLGYPEQALRFEQHAVELAEVLQHPYSLVLAIHNQTQILLYHGSKRAALDSARRGKALAIEHGFSFLQAWALYLNAWALALNAETDASLAEIKSASMAERPVSAVADSYLTVFLAEAYFLLGDADRGLACLAAPAAEHAYDAERSCLQAECTALRTDPAAVAGQAEALFHEALNLSRLQGVKAYELRAATGLARLLMRRKEYRQAYECLAPVVDWYQEGFDTADLQQAGLLVIKLENRVNGQNSSTNVVELL